MLHRESGGNKFESSDAEERREAVLELADIGSESLPLLLRAVGDVDWRVRKTAVEALLSLGGANVIAGLIQALSSHDNAGARNSAIEALVQIGGQAVDPLLGIIETPDSDVRKFVVDILGDMKDRRAVPALIERLGDADENIRVAAAEALGKIGDRRAVDALLSCLTRHNHGWLDYASAEALGEIGDERALEPLLAALSRSSLREPILEALGKIGNATTLGPLIASLADPLRIVREVSVVALAAIYRKSGATERRNIVAAVRAGLSESAIAFLEEILITSAGELQRSTITVLGWTGRESSINKLFALLKEEDLVDHVVQSLAHIDPDKAVFLVGFLSNENALVRQAVAQVLGENRIKAAEDTLIKLLQDENGHVRSTAACALGLLESRRGRAGLLELLQDEYESVQEAAIQALAAIGDESVLDTLLKDFSAHEAYLRRNIARLLGKFSSHRAHEALAFALKDEEPAVRKAVVPALGSAAGGKALRSLLLAVTDDDPEVRMLAAEALGAIDSLDAQDALIHLLEDADLWVKAAAARGLANTGGDRAGEVLTSYLGTASDIFLLAIAEVLGKLQFPKALGPLIALVNHSDPEVRKTVLLALSHYEGEVAAETVASCLSDSHWSVRKAAIEVVKLKGTAATEAFLAKIAEEDPDVTVRLAAKKALEK
ncbi:MAG TPA: HEAT repeat domain-containing protein [Nitrospirota bacterium]|nr:HEAT repeat domain-containing protein [Nitrospirota bacterium]